MVHSARALTVPLRPSRELAFLFCCFLSRELNIIFDAQAGAMSLLGHHTFSLFLPCPFGLSFLRAKDLHCVYYSFLHKHCMLVDKLTARRAETIRNSRSSAVDAVSLIVSIKNSFTDQTYILNRIYYVAAEQSYVETCEEERQARPVGNGLRQSLRELTVQ